MIARRKLLIALGADALAAPFTAVAQQQVKIAKIGVLLPTNPVATAHLLEAFRQGLWEHGYVEGKNFVLEPRYGETKPNSFLSARGSWCASRWM